MDQIKKIVILPYFGKFNSYFKLWFDSCAFNKSIDWLIFTDCDVPYEAPNIKVFKTTLKQLKEDFQKDFDFKLSLEQPYKLCDYKPLYGYLFRDYIKEYDFWGYCDCDLIFGDIDAFLDESLFRDYDKVLRNGHLSFTKNKPEINEIFRKYDTYRVVLSSPAIYNYDEAVGAYRPGFAAEMLDSGYKMYQCTDYIADIKYTNFPFRIVSDPQVISVFSFENGKVYRITQGADSGYSKTEVMYFHLQKRKMCVECDLNESSFLVIPNKFISFNENLLVSEAFWNNVSAEKENYYSPWIDRVDILKRDILRFIHEPNKFKSLKYRFSKK